MKILKLGLISIILMFSFGTTNAACDDIFDVDCVESIPYCEGEECGLERGIETIKDKIDGIEDDRPLSEYVQSVIVYLLGFVTLVAVIYIIYAGFLILTGGGDEDTTKKSKGIITYVIFGIVIIWLAYSIVIFIMDVIGTGT